MKALDTIRQAMDDYGRPAWYAYVPRSVIEQAKQETPEEFTDVIRNYRKSLNHSDKQRLLDIYLAHKVYDLVTVEELVEVSKFSDATIRKYISDNAGTFRKMGRGQYEVRDAASDRAHARRSA